MNFIVSGEYAERIDNADELLESFLDNFHDENSQVSLCHLSCGSGLRLSGSSYIYILIPIEIRLSMAT